MMRKGFRCGSCKVCNTEKGENLNNANRKCKTELSFVALHTHDKMTNIWVKQD